MATFRRKVKENAESIQAGTFLAIDPASKSLGWALYEEGIKVESGVIRMPLKPINVRLQILYDRLQQLETPDILFIEEIKGARAHDYLKYSVGVGLAAVRTATAITVPIPAWKAVAKVTEGYFKSDENDSIIIGYTGLLLAKECME